MTPGKLVRKLLGERVFARVVERYRAIFVDLDAVAECVPVSPRDREILDLGGGDGALLERVLARNPHLRATLVDRSPSVGLSLSAANRARVRLFPSTSLADCPGLPPQDVVTVADVLHHVPVAERRRFLHELREICGTRSVRLVFKEVAPQGWRATLGLLSDRYVTGDRHVSLLAPEQLVRLVADVFPEWQPRATGLLERDPPNYCYVFERTAGTARRERR